MSWTEDDTQRPSRLQLDRFATGELKGAERGAVQQGLEHNAEGIAHLEELKAARKQVRPFDAAAIRARAAAMEPPAVESAPEAVAPTRAAALPTLPDMAADLGHVEAQVAHEDDKATHPFLEERAAFPARPVDAAAEVLDEEPVAAIYNRTPTKAPTHTPPPANNFRWLMAAVPALVLAAAVAIAVLPDTTTPEDPVGITGIRAKGDPTLSVYTLSGGDLHPYAGQALGQGDVVGFQVGAAGHDGVVLLSVDGAGEVSVYWPAKGDAPEALPGTEGSVPLPGTLTLDGAAGPEVFVAVFGHEVSWAREQAQTAWKAGGASAVTEWARGEADADAVVVEKR